MLADIFSGGLKSRQSATRQSEHRKDRHLELGIFDHWVRHGKKTYQVISNDRKYRIRDVGLFDFSLCRVALCREFKSTMTFAARTLLRS
jgi:hypothetical protein